MTLTTLNESGINKTLTIILTLLATTTLGQKNPTRETQTIVAEGKLLYKSEMASWYGTDLFLETYPKKENIGGYFSYLQNDSTRCIFFSKAENPRVIGTISFDSTYSVKKAKIDLTERGFTPVENNLYQIRKIALMELNTNPDGLFKLYENTSLNLIPLIHGQEKKVYILTGPQNSGVVIFGNDYLLTFDPNNNLLTKKALHKNIIPIEYGKPIDGKEVVGSMHSHLPETGEFITATDICTLMLYARFTAWKTHTVISKEYVNLWNCETNTLTVTPHTATERINKNKEKRNKKNN